MKRADASYIKQLNRRYNGLDFIANAPLILMEKTESNKDFYKKQHDLAEDMFSRDGAYDSMKSDPAYLMHNIVPVKKFMVLDKTHKVNDPEERGVFEYNYVSVNINDDLAMSICYFTKSSGLYLIELSYNENTHVIDYAVDRWAAGTAADSKGKQDVDEYQREFLLTMFCNIYAFLVTAHESDLYPIETKGVQHRKTHAKKPWTRSDLVTIQYLNQLPAEKKPHKGGTHASPRYHQRRGAWRTFKHPRYGDKVGTKIYIKPYWAGEREAMVNGVTYKVL